MARVNTGRKPYKFAHLVSLFASLCAFVGELQVAEVGRLHCLQHGRRRPAALQATGIPETLAAYEDVFELAASVMISIACFVYTLKPQVASGKEVDRAEMLQRATSSFLRPLQPDQKKDNVVQTNIMVALRHRFEEWNGHATFISGRHGSGKTWAWQEALRDVRGVAVISVHAEPVAAAVEQNLGFNLGVLKGALERVRLELSQCPHNLTKVPVIVLEVYSGRTACVESICSFAKELSSDLRLAHVVVCDSSFVVPWVMSRRDSQGIHLFVEDFSLKEAKDALARKGHVEDWRTYIDTCGRRALDIALACDQGLEAFRSQRRIISQQVDRLCTFVIELPLGSGLLLVGHQLLNQLLRRKRQGDDAGVDQDFLHPGSICPHEVIAWIEENGAQAVVWKACDQKYHFASDFHYEALEERLRRAQIQEL